MNEPNAVDKIVSEADFSLKMTDSTSPVVEPLVQAHLDDTTDYLRTVDDPSQMKMVLGG